MALRDYTADLLGISRERARAFAKELPRQTYPLIYRAGRYRDPLTGLSHKCVDATCGRCGATMKLEYYGGSVRGGAPFGFWLYDEARAVGSGSTLNCPECGKEVEAYHVGYGKEFCRSWSWLMEPVHVRYRRDTDALALMFWRVYRCFDKQAREILSIQPYEAYVVEDDSIVCMKHWGKLFYNTFITDDWRTSKRFADTINDIYSGEIIGDLHEAMIGTTAENSKLDLYMQQAATPFPVSYLRLWQKHRNVETLLTCNAGRLLGAMIEAEKRNQRACYTPAWKNGASALSDCDWKAKRPNGILRMDRAELRAARESDLGGEQMLTLLICRRYGVPIRLPEDIPAIKKCNLSIWGRVIRHGVRWENAERYLAAQTRRYPKEIAPTSSTLADYWDMAKGAGIDLSIHAERWPMHLNRAHDQLLMRKKFKEDEALRTKFEQRAVALNRFRFEADGLMIRQPMRENDLIVEGKVLNHCVATYAKRHATGDTTILFIRRTDAPELPYFTLNINEKDLSVIQNLGKSNCSAPPEVDAFVDLFMAWARAGCKRDKDGHPVLPKKRKARDAA